MIGTEGHLVEYLRAEAGDHANAQKVKVSKTWVRKVNNLGYDVDLRVTDDVIHRRDLRELAESARTERTEKAVLDLF